MLLDLRRRVFRHTQRLSLEFHEKYTSGRIISRQTSDVDALRELLDGGVTTLAVRRAGDAVHGGLAGAARLAQRAGPARRGGAGRAPHALVPGAVAACSTGKQRTAAARLIVRFVETMTGIRAVQAFRREPQVSEVYGELAEDYRATNARSIRLNGVFDTGLTLIGNVTVAAVLLVGGLRALDGGIEVGVLVAAVLYARRFFNAAAADRHVLQLVPVGDGRAREARVAARRGADRARPGAPRAAARTPAATCGSTTSSSATAPARPSCRTSTCTSRPASRSRWSARPARASRRSPSCSPGSTTSARGAVRLDGLDLRDIDPVDLRRAVVMVTQEAYLFSGSVGANIALGKPEATPAEIEAAARAVGVHDLIASMPDGYDTEVDKRGVRLSAGPAPAGVVRARVPGRPGAADPRRGDQLARRAGGGAGAGRAADAARRPHVGRHRAPAVDRHGVGPGAGHRGRPDRRGRLTDRALVAAGGRFADLHADWQRSLRRTT